MKNEKYQIATNRHYTYSMVENLELYQRRRAPSRVNLTLSINLK